MRVITGEAKGRQLKVPKGPTRPATDLVRGAVFSILENLTDDWDVVLDLFSGSGAMGIEALSRGAGWVDFVERLQKGCATIRQNLETTGLSSRAHVYCVSVARALSFLDKTYSIILIDPPYRNPNVGELLEQLGASRLVGQKTIVVVTHPPYRPLETAYGSLKLLKEHRHGDSCINVYRKEATE
ncbi:MAG: 16S rRNA (guanine(966)-N(2))-methyltransferase RsmD [Chloroflexi bacterium]|nr:16S rRNA (guanine(966)-N(2))-methyltransferase RsmD [Chloroflexota bacterium]